jgi:hypothetical protein
MTLECIDAFTPRRSAITFNARDSFGGRGGDVVHAGNMCGRGREWESRCVCVKSGLRDYFVEGHHEPEAVIH